MKKYIVLIFSLLNFNLFADTAITNLNGSISNSIKISEDIIGNINMGTSIDVINGSFTNKTTTFSVKTNSTSSKYSIWLSANNYDSNNNLVYASQIIDGTVYRLPIKVTLLGNTLNIGNDGTTNSGNGSLVNVLRTIAQNNNEEVSSGSGQSAGEDVDGSNVNGTTYTISIDQITSIPNSLDYYSIPSGTYTVIISVNVVLTN